jgi:predicted TIM-barrel fold metal-dependent hydrolase
MQPGRASKDTVAAAFRAENRPPSRIDVHHHYLPKSYVAFMDRHGLSIGFGKWSVQADLDDMDSSGTATAILSITNPGFMVGHIEETRTAIREANEAAARLRADHPGRFGNFAALPLTDTDGTLLEIEYALDTLRADGVCLFSSYGDKWLGHASFAPVYEELNRRKAIAFVHPRVAACCVNIGNCTSIPNEGATIEFGTDTTRAIADLIYSGTTTRYPDMVWIFSHGGGTMPFLIERFLTGASAELVPGIVTKGMSYAPPRNVPRGVLHELRKMYYDTAQASNPATMSALRTVVPVSQILFGTDVWYRTTAETISNLTACGVFNPEELRAICRGNAERILPQFADQARD